MQRSDDLNVYVRKCNLPLPHTNYHLYSLDEDLLNGANARF